MRVTPVLGFIAVTLLFFCIEPTRGQSEGLQHLEASTYSEDLRNLLKNTTFMLSTAGFTCVAFVAGALAWWGPTYIFLGQNVQYGHLGISLNE